MSVTSVNLSLPDKNITSINATLWHNDFASSPSLTAAVSGGNVLVSVPGIAGKTLNWTVKSGI